MAIMNLVEIQQYFEKWHYTKHKFVEMLETRDLTRNIAVMWQSDLIEIMEALQGLYGIAMLVDEKDLELHDENILSLAKYHLDEFDYYCQGV